MQRVTTKDIPSVKAFHKAMHDFAECRHQLEEQITWLETTIHYPPTTAEQQGAECLMKLRTEGKRAADKVC